MLRSLACALPFSLAFAAPSTAQIPLSLEINGNVGNGYEPLSATPMTMPHELSDALIELKVDCDEGWWVIVVFRVWAANNGSPGFPYDPATGFAHHMQTTYGFTPATEGLTVSALSALSADIDSADFNALQSHELCVAPEQVNFYGSKFLGSASAHVVKNWAQPILAMSTSATWDGSPSWFTGQTDADNDYQATWKNIQLGSDASQWLDVAGFADVAALRQGGQELSEDDYGNIVAAEDLFVTLQAFAFRDPSGAAGSSATTTSGISNNPKPNFRVAPAATLRIPLERVARGREADSSSAPMVVNPGSLILLDHIAALDGHCSVWFEVQGGGKVERPMFKVGPCRGMVRVPSNVKAGFIDIENQAGTLFGAISSPGNIGSMFVTPFVPNNP